MSGRTAEQLAEHPPVWEPNYFSVMHGDSILEAIGAEERVTPYYAVTPNDDFSRLYDWLLKRMDYPPFEETVTGAGEIGGEEVIIQLGENEDGEVITLAYPERNFIYGIGQEVHAFEEDPETGKYIHVKVLDPVEATHMMKQIMGEVGPAYPRQQKGR